MDDHRRLLISIVVPVYNESENITPFYERLCAVLATLDDYSFEIVFTDNHSEDGTFAQLVRLAAGDPRVRVYRFSRNFGFQRSIYTGYLKARGDAAIQLDVDLQDPPELIPRFIEEWQKGYRVVYGVRKKRQESRRITIARKGFYRVVAFLSEDPLPLDAGDFRLVDRAILDQLRTMPDSQPYLRGAIASLGFSQLGVPYDRANRERGESKFRMRDLIGLSLDAILNHSIVPLRVASYVGITIGLLTIVGFVVFVIIKLLFGAAWPAGFATTTVLILVAITLNALFLGIIGEYLGRIYRQVKPRPITVVEASAGDPDQSVQE
jgi:glycosyltransferase involved in cell wall biosynthesis